MGYSKVPTTLERACFSRATQSVSSSHLANGIYYNSYLFCTSPRKSSALAYLGLFEGRVHAAKPRTNAKRELTHSIPSSTISGGLKHEQAPSGMLQLVGDVIWLVGGSVLPVGGSVLPNMPVLTK